MDSREERGLGIYALGNQIKRLTKHAYRVHSQTNGTWYSVKWNGLEWDCDCPDRTFRQTVCKHICAVRFSLEIRKRVIDSTPNVNIEPEYSPTPEACPQCYAVTIIKWGKRKVSYGFVQTYLCKRCGFKFSTHVGFQKVQHMPKLVVLTLDLYFEGISIRKIVDHIKQFYGVRVGVATIFRWIRKYVNLMSEYTSDLLPQTGDVWHADDMMLKVKANGGEWHYLWNLMDSETRFLIASRMSSHRTGEEAKRLFRQARDSTSRLPKQIITDKLRSYSEAYDDVLERKGVQHVASPQFIDRANNNRVERLHGTVREREKVMRAMGNNRSAQEVMDGYKLWYNFIRPHMALNGRTPAEVAKLTELEGNRWLELIQQATVARERRNHTGIN